MKSKRLAGLALTAWAATLLTGSGTAAAAGVKQARELFANPPAEYAVAPLWVWNDMLTEQQIRETLRDMAAQKVMQVFVHPRPGLMTPYLSEDWFKLWKIALDEGRKLGMRVWIYDENSYPSGFAGGEVPEQMPESRGRGLLIQETPPGADEELIAAYAQEGQGFKNFTEQIKSGKPEGKVLYAVMDRSKPSPWYGGKTYVDLMYPGVTQKFLDITLEAYKRNLGDEFGKMVPGSFTDEPELRPARGMAWTPDLPEVFAKLWKYNLLDNLPSLVRDVGEYKKVRHDYIYVLNHLFIERWSKPYSEWCEKNHIDFTGHYWDHSWPDCLNVPDNMAMYAWHQYPAIDNLMNNYSEDLHAQLGNTRTVKELSSVANQMGRTRTLCEAYGAGGWDLRFEDMKRIGDWLYVLGVNTLDPHVSYITIRGARKRDHPQSFSYHEPWWEAYHTSAQYFARLSAAMSQGKQINDTLVIEPTTTVWMYNSNTGDNPPRTKIAKSFEALVRDLEKAQVEYDLGSEDVIARHGSAEGRVFVVGKCRYKLVVLPAFTENLESKTVDLLSKFLDAGGNVVCLGDSPSLVDGRPSDRAALLAKKKTWMQVTEKKGVPLLRGRQRALGLNVYPKTDEEGQLLYHHRRVLDDGELMLLVNTRIDKPVAGTLVSSRAGGMEKWDLQTGRIEPAAAKVLNKKLELEFELPPCGSMLVFLSKEKQPAVVVPPSNPAKIATDGQMEVKRLDPNVIVLDYVDVTCRNETKKSVSAIKAGHWIFSQHGLTQNPWAHAVQFRDELIRKTFPADSGFQATYRFTVEEKVPASLFAAIERTDLYTITCNGTEVKALAGQWYLDKAFGKIDISSAAKVGENVLTLKASPMTMFHELEAAYIIGDFAAKPSDRGFSIAPDRPMKQGPWNDQIGRLYSHRVSYKQKFNVASKRGKYRVELPNWYGSTAKVIVNGKDAGYIGWRPWQCDVTEQVVSGSNEIEVIVIGTLRNMLGPWHKPDLGAAWPNMWDQSPENGPPAGKTYTSVAYGLYEPFVLISE